MLMLWTCFRYICMLLHCRRCDGFMSFSLGKRYHHHHRRGHASPPAPANQRPTVFTLKPICYIIICGCKFQRRTFVYGKLFHLNFLHLSEPELKTKWNASKYTLWENVLRFTYHHAETGMASPAMWMGCATYTHNMFRMPTRIGHSVYSKRVFPLLFFIAPSVSRRLGNRQHLISFEMTKMLNPFVMAGQVDRLPEGQLFLWHLKVLFFPQICRCSARFLISWPRGCTSFGTPHSLFAIQRTD